jgi:hypothetical protein
MSTLLIRPLKNRAAADPGAVIVGVSNQGNGTPPSPSTAVIDTHSQEVVKTTAPTTALVGESSPSKKESADPRLILLSYILILIGTVIGTVFSTVWPKTKLIYTPLDGLSLFTFFFILAYALERFIEPFSEFEFGKYNFGSRRKKVEAERDKHIFNVQIALSQGTDATQLQNDANTAADLDAKANAIKANTKVLMWAFASFIGILLSGLTGIYILEIVGIKGIQEWLNVLITGLAIGAGTAPLHKFTKILEKKADKDEKES